MRGIALLVVITVAIAAMNGAILLWIGGFANILWALTFCVAIPAYAIWQAVQFSRDDQHIPKQRRPSLLVLTTAILVNAAILPFLEDVWDAETQVCD